LALQGFCFESLDNIDEAFRSLVQHRGIAPKIILACVLGHADKEPRTAQ
jgi:hypothetical protein